MLYFLKFLMLNKKINLTLYNMSDNIESWEKYRRKNKNKWRDEDV